MRLTVKFGLAVLVLCGAVYLFVFPAQTYLAQKQDIVGQEQTIAVLQAENTKLAARKRRAPERRHHRTDRPVRVRPRDARPTGLHGAAVAVQAAGRLRHRRPAPGPLVRVPGVLASPVKDRR